MEKNMQVKEPNAASYLENCTEQGITNLVHNVKVLYWT